ncbi:uncharacterized protein LOC126906202 isoform X1 [Daktulosphaira vitifoliae]|uniref:uncharacterized protein LOC126906202 isoform X1 n=1 Tax=Daktulosphaira vitifoliae TaxID=58002 RepID=UPI0021A9F900|nr:uncharacterized protein LOC126906202 isoform X1 [Daktulosphaira vitifoliae]
MDTVTVHYWSTETKSFANKQTHSILLVAALIFSMSTTVMLCSSIWTDHWDSVEWDIEQAIELLKTQNQSKTWFNKVYTEWIVNNTILKVTITTEKTTPRNNGDDLLVLAKYNHYKSDYDSMINDFGETVTVILTPMYGGIWTQCNALTDGQFIQLQEELVHQLDSKLPKCMNYLAEDNTLEEQDFRPDWHLRMLKVSISCALVCIIIVGTALLIGLFSILQHQISAMLITAVLYILASTFGFFTLGIMYNKRRSTKIYGHKNCNRSLILISGMIKIGGDMCPTLRFWEYLLTSRIYSHSWSMSLGWIAVFFCIITSFLWILLSKNMKNAPANMIFIN